MDGGREISVSSSIQQRYNSSSGHRPIKIPRNLNFSTLRNRVTTFYIRYGGGVHRG